MSRVTREQAKKLVGSYIYAKRRDGSVVTGKLVRVSGDRLVLERPQGKKISTKAIIPLVLFDLLAIGTAPYAYGGGWGYGGGFGYGGYDGFYGGGWW